MIEALFLNLALSLGLTALTIYPMERVFPAKFQPILRPSLKTDLAFALGQFFLFNGIAISLLASLRMMLQGFMPSSIVGSFHSLPWLLQAVLVLFLGDLTLYWFHRWQHSNRFLWSFHSIHHTAEHLDWVAGYREHPVDGILMQLAANAPGMLLAFPFETIIPVIGFRGIWASFIHANVKVSLGPLKYLIGAPELHHWHHAKELPGCNFANMFPFLDLIFGTHRSPSVEPSEFGVQEQTPKSYLGLLLYPFQALFRIGRGGST